MFTDRKSRILSLKELGNPRILELEIENGRRKEKRKIELKIYPKGSGLAGKIT